MLKIGDKTNFTIEKEDISYLGVQGRDRGVYLSSEGSRRRFGKEGREFINKQDAEKYSLEGVMNVYVDGSYHPEQKTYGGGIIYENAVTGRILRVSISGYFGDNGNSGSLFAELKTALVAMKFAVERGYEFINLYYDNNVISQVKRCNNKKLNKWIEAYMKEYERYVEGKLSIHFMFNEPFTSKVFLDEADALAKKSSIDYYKELTDSRKLVQEMNEKKVPLPYSEVSNLFEKGSEHVLYHVDYDNLDNIKAEVIQDISIPKERFEKSETQEELAMRRSYPITNIPPPQVNKENSEELECNLFL